MDRAVSLIFVLGRTPSCASDDRSRMSEPISLASLSFEELGGVEYSALRVLLKVVAGQSPFFSLACRDMVVDVGRLFLWSPSSRCTVPPALDLDCKPKVPRVSCFPRPGQHLVVNVSQ
jgi:hypothetical protein